MVMEESEKKSLYKTLLKRENAFVVFLASGETNLSLLPTAITLTEKLLMKLCEEKVKALENSKSQKAEKPAVRKTSAKRNTT